MRPGSSAVIVIDERDEALFIVRYRKAAPWPGRSIAIAATIVIHLLLAAPLVLGTGPQKSRPRTPDGPGSVEWKSKGEEAQPMILLDLSALSAADPDDADVPTIDAEGIVLEQLKLAIARIEPMVPDEPIVDESEVADTENQQSGDPSASVALFGKYMSHVAARIERAWMRPRAPIDTGHFDCRARIEQDRRGNVLSVRFDDRCPDSDVWRKSLESAILRASPLSAPPEPWLLTPQLTLNFSANQYERGVTPDYLYEPALARLASTSSASGSTSSRDELALMRDSLSEGNDVELTIDGNDVKWKKKKSDASKQ